MQRTLSPIDGSVYVERELASPAGINAALDRARLAQRAWRSVSVAERAQILSRFCDVFESQRDDIATELTWQMGRPIAYTAKEITTAVKRAEYLLKISGDVLKDTDGEAEKGFKRFIRKMPVGPILILFAWNASISSLRIGPF